VYRGEQPDFNPANLRPVAEVTPNKYSVEYYKDTGLQPQTTYYYRVLAEDWAGNRQSTSPLASASTPEPGVAAKGGGRKRAD
jgi:phosphodiesterase/alkaline phosphatase D-like protein